MNLRPRILELTPEITKIRQTLHRNPQLGYEETFANNLVTQKLTEWGIPFERGWAETGIVGWIKGKKTTSGKAIGLRGDMDALPIHEESGVQWCSCSPGCMHACGHDGHTATLLGTAKYLSENPNFDGTVYLIFQPAEEGGGGAMKMLEEGLFEKHKMDLVFAIHNWPWAPVGFMGTRPGPVMAGDDLFTIRVKGIGGHAAQPHNTRDPVVAAAHLVTALQTITSRNVDPVEQVVVTVASLNAGTGAHNVIPDIAELKGTVRFFDPDLRKKLENRVHTLARSIAEAFEVEAEVDYICHYHPTINDPEATRLAVEAARATLGEQGVVIDNAPPVMGSEDFGALLARCPGAYLAVGQGSGNLESPHDQALHSSKYDFNDRIIPIVMEYFTQLVERNLPAAE